MSPWRRVVRLTVAVTLLCIVYFTIPLTREIGRGEIAQIAVGVVALALLGFMVVWEVRQQLVDQSRNIDRLALAMAVAVMGFALGFYIMAQRDPTQITGLHTRLDSLYFTMTTLLTIGYGDIHAAGQLARGVVLVQMVFNVAILATASTTLTHQIRERANTAAERRQGPDTQRKPT
jgi:voltage-gated potassium channel